ncbi:class A beta-lactamase [Roseiterribacter gracilis]|uniref:beta-lactamase n=1 Tax=Roseiterribacter gracilis TaxID=2812848 RepID=A0A8S8X8E6_9PROT|nr:beta-lactamase [Rhodospirillales bacterium TMPK1]
MRVRGWLLVVLCVVATPAQAGFDSTQLRNALTALTAHPGSGRLGVAVRDLEDGSTVLIDAKRPFPMQSVYKLPIAIALLDRVDRGRIALSKTVHLTQAQRAPGRSPLAKQIGPEGLDRTIEQLLELMMIESDNTACDVLLDEVGGPAAVQAVLLLKSLYGVRVDRPEKQLQSDWQGLGHWRAALYEDRVREAAIEALPPQRRQIAIDAYLRDPRDTTTPQGMMDMLARLAAGELLSADSTTRLLHLMTVSVTGLNKIKAGLPQDWALAHKSGASGEAFGLAPAENDVGIATAPDGRRIVIVALLSASRLNSEARDKMLADVARATIAALR